MVMLYAGKEGAHTSLAVSPEHSRKRDMEAVVTEYLLKPCACNSRHASLCGTDCDSQRQLWHLCRPWQIPAVRCHAASHRTAYVSVRLQHQPQAADERNLALAWSAFLGRMKGNGKISL